MTYVGGKDFLEATDLAEQASFGRPGEKMTVIEAGVGSRTPRSGSVVGSEDDEGDDGEGESGEAEEEDEFSGMTAKERMKARKQQAADTRAAALKAHITSPTGTALDRTVRLKNQDKVMGSTSATLRL